ncbi:hypothetical protein ABZP36_019874 [Zizania latifolia]
MLLPTFFTYMRYEDSSIPIRYVIYSFQSMLLTSSGSKCLAECFVNARGKELYALEGAILDQAATIAKGNYNNYFIQCVLNYGSKRLKRSVVERLMVDVVGVC